MSIDGLLLLPPDVQLAPVRELPQEIRSKIDASEQDYTITRPLGRAPSSLIDGDSAALLQCFRAPKRIVDAVLSFALDRDLDPERTLEAAFPMLQRLYRAQLLVPASSDLAGPIEGELEPGRLVGGFRLLRRVQVLGDCEVFVARDGLGQLAAVKFRRKGDARVHDELQREADALERIRRHAPRVLGLEPIGSGWALITDWVPGAESQIAAEQVREAAMRSEYDLLAICIEVASAFAEVHEAGLIHGDVHPSNVLVESSGAVKLIDFALAREVGASSDDDDEGGVPFYFDPERAQALRTRRSVAHGAAAEQYSVAALLFQLWTGLYYLDFRLERDEMLRQIEQDEPVSFEARGAPQWAALERILRRALDKRPERRFADLHSLASALRELLPEARRRDAEALERRSRTGRETGAVDRVFERYALGGEALRNGPDEAPLASINHGAAGIAYALLRVAQHRGDERLLASADLWAQKAYALAAGNGAFHNAELQIERGSVGDISLFHSPSGLHCVRALVSAAQGDVATTNGALRAFVSHSRLPNPELDAAQALDLTLGLGSVLLGSAELVDALAPASLFDLEAVKARAAEIVEQLLAFVREGPIEGLRGPRTLGLAHGWAGLLFALLRWGYATQQAPDAIVRVRLEELARLAEPHGAGLHWPVDQGASSFMDGWCNGAAGYALLFALAQRAFGSSNFGEAAERAAIGSSYSRSQAGSLCCGWGGIAYAMLAVHRLTGSRRWLDRARVAATLAADDRSPRFQRDALYKGAIGVELLTEELKNPGSSAMPLVEPVE
jgi:serine/threonine protein kinase